MRDDRTARREAPAGEGDAIVGPARTCAGCGKRDAAGSLVHLALGEATPRESGARAHAVVVDLKGTAKGRGAHVHPAPDCVAKAAKQGLSRAFKCAVDATAEDLSMQIDAAASRRFEGLLVGARRARHVAAGADVVVEACREGKAKLLVVATDAASAAKLTEVRDAIAAGRAIAWGDKRELGALLGRDEVAVCAVLDEGLAAAMERAHRLACTFRSSRSQAWWSPEVR